MSSLKEYTDWTATVWFSSDRPNQLELRDFAIMVLGLGGEAGEVQEVMKKWIRDAHCDPEKLDRTNLVKELGDVIYYWARICHAFGIDPDQVLQRNQDKLAGRIARGTLRGSGDDR